MSYVIPVFAQSAQKLVLQYIEKHPLCTAGDIIGALEQHPNAVRTNLCRLRAGGFIQRIKIKGHRHVRWQIGQDETYEPPSVKDGFKRIMVSEWEPCTVRDPLIWLSYGVNPQPVQESLL